MCQTSPMMSEVIVPMTRLSVFECGINEALVHKWIESEKAKQDLGMAAIREWVRQHWNGFLRARWMDHIEGKAFWIELDQDDYGLLKYAFLGDSLMTEVLDRLKRGGENLDLILWALAEGVDMEQLFEMLEVLDINSRRIECLFAQRLAQAG